MSQPDFLSVQKPAQMSSVTVSESAERSQLAGKWNAKESWYLKKSVLQFFAKELFMNQKKKTT